MKRYWKMILTLLVTILVIGIFYIQSSLASKDGLTFEIKTISGNEAELKNISIHGAFRIDEQHQNFEITSEKAIYFNNQSFIQWWATAGVDPILEKLVDNHRGFMRGKERVANNFFEDNKLVAYANIRQELFNDTQTPDFTFEIEVLNKKSEETISIELDVPEKEKYSWVHVGEVKANEGELNVITRVSRIDGEEELRVYTFNLEKQKLVNDSMIISAQKGESGWTDIIIINDTYSIQPQKYFAIRLEAVEEGYRAVGEEMVNNEFLIYNIATKQSKKITVPNEKLRFNDSATIVNSTIYWKFVSEYGLEVSRYDIEKDQWGESLKFEPQQVGDNGGSPFVKLMNGKIYVISSSEKSNPILIGDLKTGRTLYKGEIEVNTAENETKKDYELYIDDIVSVN